MDFFDRQDVARKKTGRLVFMFAGAVLTIIVATYFLIAAIVGFGMNRAGGGQEFSLLNWQLFGIVALGVLFIVGSGSMYKIAMLRGGGHVIAEHLGGRRVHNNTTDPAERKVLNIVQEMALASGTPVPPVFMMDHEPGINAFAAGYSPDDAVIGVSRGSAQILTRDELQGVIAHEFSHILNGDMRLNIRLMGVLNGILIIGIIGYYLMRSMFYTTAFRRSSRDKGGGAGAMLAIGLGLMVIGFAGTFFGNLIKAAVSRQREFLADASAVQFTRNPDGIAGALKKIGGFQFGSKINNPNAPEASHMFFGRAISSGLNSMFSTHPPLDERIKRIDPSWNGKFPPVKTSADATTTSSEHAAISGIASAAPTSHSDMSKRAVVMSASAAVSSVGQPTPQHFEQAARLLQSIPQVLRDLTSEPYGARAVMYSLLINRDTNARQAQLERLAGHADRPVYELTVKLVSLIEKIDPALRLPIVDLAIPALRELSPTQYQSFRMNLIELIKADRKLELFEWSLQRIILRHVEPQFRNIRPAKIKYYALSRLHHHCAALLSALAHAGHTDTVAAKHAFDQAAAVLQITNLRFMPQRECGPKKLDAALDELNTIAPKLKRQIIEACATCVLADEKVTVDESELLRAIADALGCPMPPMLAGG